MTPTELWDRLAQHQGRHGHEEPTTSWIALDDLLAEDAGRLRALHATLVSEDTPAKAGANYLAGWYGGSLAESVGFLWAMGGVGVSVEDSVRWRATEEGWPDRVDLTSCTLLVPLGHPWADLPGVEALENDDDVRDRTLASLVALITPYIEACRTLAKVGRNALWAEVADGLGMATTYATGLEGATDRIESLIELVNAPGVPWRKRPTLWCADGPGGQFVAGRKGGCCLAYTAEPHEHDPEELDEEHRAYLERFPPQADSPQYCATCSFRDLEDVEARQVFWQEQHLTPSATLTSAGDPA